MITFVLAVLIAFSVSFLCSILESTLLSLSISDIAKISEKSPLFGRIWNDFKRNIHKPIAVILIINTLSHTIGATLSGAQFNILFGSQWLWVFSLAFSLVMIQWTEILAKTLGVKYNRKIAFLTALPISFMVRLFKPLVYMTQLLNRPFEGKKRMKNELDTLDEIRALARMSSTNKIISEDQENLITRGTKLSNTPVSQIMVPVQEIKFLSTTMSLMQALVEAHIHHHTRYPLAVNGNVNEIMGYVNFKDIVTALRINPKNPTLIGILRPVLVVQPHENLNQLLARLTKGHHHIGVVLDQHSKTLGLITLEDIFEFMLGDILDEYDVLPDYFYPIFENRYLAGGGASLLTIKADLGDSIPDLNFTLNEWLIELFGKTPNVEETKTIGNLKFIIRKIRRTRIFEVIIEVTPK